MNWLVFSTVVRAIALEAETETIAFALSIYDAKSIIKNVAGLIVVSFSTPTPIVVIELGPVTDDAYIVVSVDRTVSVVCGLGEAIDCSNHLLPDIANHLSINASEFVDQVTVLICILETLHFIQWLFAFIF